MTYPAVDVALHTDLAAAQPKSTSVEYYRTIGDFDRVAKFALRRLEGSLLAWLGWSEDDCRASRVEHSQECSGLPNHKNPGCLDQCWCSMRWLAVLERCGPYPNPVSLRLDEGRSYEVVAN